MTEMVPEIVEERHLSKAEESRLQELEGVIEANFKGFVAVGMALAEIQERRLYRRRYKTFEEYCQDIWEVNRRRAYQLIDASNVVQNVKNFSQNQIPLPANDAQARELAKLQPEEQIQVWQDLVEKSQRQRKKITAKAVKKAVLSHRGEAVREHIKKSTQEARENRTDFQSEEFTEAFQRFFEAVENERQANWRNTSRNTVFRLLAGLMDVVSLAVPGTLDSYGCSMELPEREKLQKAGFQIVRMDAKSKVIEKWHSRDNWEIYQEFSSHKDMNDKFKMLLEDHMHLKG